MLPSTIMSVSASAVLWLSKLNPTPHQIAVYASQPPSPTPTQHSLPGGPLRPYPCRSFTGWNRQLLLTHHKRHSVKLRHVTEVLDAVEKLSAGAIFRRLGWSTRIGSRGRSPIFHPGVGLAGVLQRSLRLRGAQLSRRWSLAEEADELAQVLRRGGEQEFVFRAAQSSQSQPAEVEVALEMRETHLDLLSQTR